MKAKWARGAAAGNRKGTIGKGVQRRKRRGVDARVAIALIFVSQFEILKSFLELTCKKRSFFSW
jgi:hypothetical protein